MPKREATRRLGILLGYGMAASDFANTGNPVDLGFGLRGGSTLGKTRLYLGGTAAFHLGDIRSDTPARLGYGLAEFGYDAVVGPVSILPYLGLGGSFVLSDRASSSAPPIGVALAAGLSVQSIRPGMTVGADIRLIGCSASVATSEDTVEAVAGAIAYLFVGKGW